MKKPNTITINKSFVVSVKTDKDDNTVIQSVAVSDSATVDAPVYEVAFKTGEYRQPDSKYLLDTDTFTDNVNKSATAFVVNDIVNTIGKMTASIDNMLSSDTVDIKTVADKIAQRDALKKFIKNKSHVASTDKIATAFAFAIVQPKYSKYIGSDELIKAIRSAYDNKLTDKSVKSTRDTVLDFCSRSVSIDDSTKSTVYKNIKVTLNLDATRELINVVSASPLVYTRKGIADKRMTVNKALAQLLLFVLRDSFDLSVDTVKTDNTSYLLIG